MKIILIILYATNIRGGEPIVVRNYASENLAACQKTVEAHQFLNKWGSLSLYCVPIYEMNAQ